MRQFNIFMVAAVIGILNSADCKDWPRAEVAATPTTDINDDHGIFC